MSSKKAMKQMQKLTFQKHKNNIRNNKYAAGWSSLVARQAHNLKVVGSNPTPATNHTNTFLI